MQPEARVIGEGRHGRLWGGLVLGSIAILCAGVLWALILWHGTPGFWQSELDRRSRHSPRQQAATALAFESRTNHAFTALPRAAGDQTRELHISFDDINDWLAQRLRLWLESQGVKLPREVQSVVVAARPPLLLVAALVDTPDVTQVFSLALRVEIEPDGMAVVRLERIFGGNLPLPVGLALREIPPDVRETLPPDIMDVIHSLGQGLRVEPAFRIDSTRRVRLLDLRMHEDGLSLRMAQEPAH